MGYEGETLLLGDSENETIRWKELLWWEMEVLRGRQELWKEEILQMSCCGGGGRAERQRKGEWSTLGTHSAESQATGPREQHLLPDLPFY